MEFTHISQYADQYVDTLSGGIRQRVFFAMVLAQDCDYIVLDEPTTYLDLTGQREFYAMIKELKKQGKALLDARRDNFVRQSLLSDEFLNFMQQNKKPFDLLMSYYECAIMEVETKFRVLNHELSLEYDNNPIESIKTRVKSYDSILKKIRRKNIPLNLRAIEDNLKDIAGVRVICSFPDDIYKLAESFLKQDDITLIERKDYIKNPKPSGYRSLHLIVQVPIFLQNEKKMVNVEVQFRTIAMDFWASLDHKMRYKKELSDEEVEILQEELYDCARQSAVLDERMQGIRDRITKKQEQETILLEDKNSKDWL